MYYKREILGMYRKTLQTVSYTSVSFIQKNRK